MSSRLSAKHVRVVGLKPNKNLPSVNRLFEAGQLAPVIDGQYKLADIAEAFRRTAAADHKGKIVITIY